MDTYRFTRRQNRTPTNKKDGLPAETGSPSAIPYLAKPHQKVEAHLCLALWTWPLGALVPLALAGVGCLTARPSNY